MTRTIDRTQIESLREALAGRGVTMEYFETGAEAFTRLRELVPLATEVSTGSSTTLDQIGFTDWLNDLHREGKLRYFRAETQQVDDPEARTENRRLATLAEYFLGSISALTEDGIAVVADAAGTRVAGYVFGARNVIWVVGINKIVPTLEDAVRRVWEVALPQEDARIKSIGGHGSHVGKMVMFHSERPGRIRMLLIGEQLGF